MLFFFFFFFLTQLPVNVHAWLKNYGRGHTKHGVGGGGLSLRLGSARVCACVSKGKMKKYSHGVCAASRSCHLWDATSQGMMSNEYVVRRVSGVRSSFSMFRFGFAWPSERTSNTSCSKEKGLLCLRCEKSGVVFYKTTRNNTAATAANVVDDDGRTLAAPLRSLGGEGHVPTTL